MAMSGPERIRDWGLQPGALWVLPDGSTYPVRGFHKEWLRENLDISNGFQESVDVIIKLNWLSVVMLNEGRVEICVSDLADHCTVDIVYNLLAKNLMEWKKALLISMREEGYVRFTKEEFLNESSLFEFLVTLRTKQE